MLLAKPFRSRSALFAAAIGLSSVACTTGAGGDEGVGDPGNGSISGRFGGRAFDTVGTSYRIGQPDDADRTIVVYLFDADVACDAISDAAWDERIGDEIQSLEIKLVGTEPATFAVATGPTPSVGEADVNYTLTATQGTPTETAASGGSVALDGVAGDRAQGSFDLTFPAGDTLSGVFDAAPCDTGREP